MTERSEADAAAELTTASRRLARFGPFELDLRSGELRREGVRLRIQEQPLQILLMLIERSGEVVTRDELRERLWPTDFVDFEHGLNTAVRKLRESLGDSAERPRFVETLARRGYRFIVPVVWVGSDSSAEPVPDDSPEPRPGLTSGARLAIAAGIALVLLLSGLLVWQRRRSAPSREIESVAVLPFVHDTTATEPLSDGMTELLIDSLARDPRLRVLARSTVFRYESPKTDAIAAGRELGVSGVVTGSIRRDDDRYDIRVELIDVRDRSLVWGERYQASSSMLPTVQASIAQSLAERLRARDGAPPPRVAGMTGSREAYDFYIRGLYAWNRRGREDLLRAAELFQRATDADPKFAAPWSGLASTYGVMVGSGWLPPMEGAPKVLAAATKALELDPLNAEAHAAIGATTFRQMWDYDGAEREFKEAIRLNPSYATGHTWYGEFLRAMGRAADARAEFERAYQLDPLSPPVNAAICWSRFKDRRYREAVDFSRKAGELDPRFVATRCLTQSLLALGDYEALAKALDAAPALGPEGRELAAATRKEGRSGYLGTRIAQLSALPDAEFFAVDIATFHAMDGDRDEAFRWLEIAHRNRVSMLTSVPFDPRFDSLRTDPRLADLFRRIRLPEAAIAAATRPLDARSASPR
jgi:TolB-like protein/DNA-binding winged helix-turn-helix (wHTH) protein